MYCCARLALHALHAGRSIAGAPCAIVPPAACGANCQHCHLPHAHPAACSTQRPAPLLLALVRRRPRMHCCRQPPGCSTSAVRRAPHCPEAARAATDGLRTSQASEGGRLIEKGRWEDR